MSEMADAIRALSAEKGISEDSIRQTIENMIKAAYRKTYPAAGDNCVVEFADDMSDVTVYAMKTVVDGVYDPATEIELEEARKVADDAAVGDTMKVLVDPKNFVRASVSVGKQNAHQALNESFKDNLYNEYRDKVGQVIIGYYQRERNGNIYVDLGKVEGVLPQKYQAPHESYEKNERIRSYVKEIRKNSTGIQLILSRTDPEFVKRIIEVEVSEVSDGIVSIYKVVREAGYRTKIAVTSTKADVDPVGACVGLKGMRIQNVIRELGGEKIDILRYDDDPHVFIKNALSPAEVKRVVILDAEKKEALAIGGGELAAFDAVHGGPHRSSVVDEFLPLRLGGGTGAIAQQHLRGGIVHRLQGSQPVGKAVVAIAAVVAVLGQLVIVVVAVLVRAPDVCALGCGLAPSVVAATLLGAAGTEVALGPQQA